ncbi:MAG: hypothetical protein NC210_08180 [[Clostridium] fimetarium]|nr:hypothetical protein [Alistipes timonensis]MCM1406382.1 hypothetical protein [[Clostridium] fimetarium]
MKLSSITFAAAGAILASGCNAAKQGGSEAALGAGTDAPTLAVESRPMSAPNERGSAPALIPKAVAYRMSGPYAANVPVTVNAAGEIVSYPAPSDLAPDSEPIDLGGGWWLDRRGVSDNSVFTRYTYAEYRALKTAPTIAELREAIIPGARVSDTFRLPMTTSEAVADPDAAKAVLPVYRLKR